MRADTFGSRPRRVALGIRVVVPAELAGDAAGILRGEASGPVAEGDAEPGEHGRPRRRLEAGLDPGAGGDAAVARLAARLEALEQEHPGSRFDLEREEQLVEEDWGAVSADRFAPFEAVPGLVVRPPWRAYAPREGERVLVIDPGAAFGSGVHASTRLALALIRERCAAAAPPRVLDVGTGTGVLALAAALWGARRVLGVDTDPDAVAAARANAARNAGPATVEIRAGGVEAAEGCFELVAANLTAEVLVPLAGALAGRLAPRGGLVLSGILAGGQDAEVEAACAGTGLRCTVRRGEGEWVAMLMVLEGGTGP